MPSGLSGRPRQLDKWGWGRGGLAGLEGCVLAPGRCAGRHFLQEAHNYRMAYFSSVVLSLISSLELVLQARHNMRGQTHAPSSAGPLPPLPALPWQHLPPSGPSSHTWRGARDRFSDPGGREGAKQLLGGVAQGAWRCLKCGSRCRAATGQAEGSS